MGDVRQTLHDVAAFAARLGVGGIFFAIGWDKLEAGLNATGDQFATIGAPAPYLWAGVTMLTELIGGAMLIAGLAVPACGLLLFLEALAVFIVGSGDANLPLIGDLQLIVALGAASILLATGGAGRLSVDHMVVIKRRGAEIADDLAAEAEDVLASLRDPTTPAEQRSPARETAGETPREKTRETEDDGSGSPSRPEPEPAPEDDAPPAPGDRLVAGRRTPRAGKPR